MLDVIQRLPAYVDLTAALADATARAELPPQALLAAARPALVAALAAQHNGPILFVTARNEMATQWIEQLKQWLPAPEAGGPSVYHLADPDALPYERIHWSSATRQRRLTALAALQGRVGASNGRCHRGRRGTCAHTKDTASAAKLRMALRPLKVGQVVRLDQMALQWVETGYNPADVVEEAGTFRAAAASSISGRPICPIPCALISSATRWRACASLTRRPSARCARCRVWRLARAARH